MSDEDPFPQGTTIEVVHRLTKYAGTVQLHLCRVTFPDSDRVEIALRNYLVGAHRYIGTPFLIPEAALGGLLAALARMAR